MRGWWQDLMDLAVPSECAGCGRPRTVLCPRCAAALHGRTPRRVRPQPEPAGLPVVHAAAPYEDAVRALLLAHKERGALALAGPLGRALAEAVRAGQRHATGGARARQAGTGARDGNAARERTPDACVLLVPVPSAPHAVRARGHDPVRRIAVAAAAELRRSGTPARVLAVLRQRRRVADQSGLGPRQRHANLAGALSVAAGAGGLLRDTPGPAVLVDDLVTTGASLTEGARALNAAGVEKVIHAAVVAAAPDSFEGPTTNPAAETEPLADSATRRRSRP